MLPVLLLAAITCSLQSTPEWTIERVIRIGALDHPDYGLTRVGALAVGPNNSLFVSQPSEHHIKVFDREGRFVRRIGREGRGPGEFNAISEMHFVRGRLRVQDRTNGRLTEMGADGRVRQTQRAPAVPVDPPFFLVPPFVIASDGTQYLVPNFRVGEQPVDSIPLFAYTPAGEFHTIAHIREGGRISRGRGGRLVVVHQLPVNDRTLYAVDHRDGDVVLIDAPLAADWSRSEWRMTRVRTSGDTVFNRRYVYDPAPVPAGAATAEARIRIDAIVRSHEAVNFPATREQVEAAFRDGFRVPPFQAAIDELVIGLSGEIWVRRGAFGEEMSEWLILAPEGDCLGRLRLPARTRVGFATRQHVGLIEVDDLDMNYVGVYRIVRRGT